MFHLAVRRGERSAEWPEERERRAPAAKEKEERGRTGIDRESKVTNTKVIVLLSHPVERIYRIPCDDTRFSTLGRSRGRRRKEEERRERGKTSGKENE